ncbi:MAG: hypothetical protein ACTS7D_01740 [Candidatus Hodgkinia cicadicola]
MTHNADRRYPRWGASPINVNENETCGQQVSENEGEVEFVRRERIGT